MLKQALIGAGGASGNPPVDITWIQRAGNSANRTNYTFTVSFGAEDPDRIIGFLFYTATYPISTTRINGITCSFWDFPALSGLDVRLAFAWARVPTGTSGTIYWATTGSSQNRGIAHVFRIISKSDDPHTWDADVGSPYDMSFNVSSGDSLIGGAYSSATGVTTTWTGMTKDEDYSLEGSMVAGAHENLSVSNPSYPVTVVYSNFAVGIVGVQWKP